MPVPNVPFYLSQAASEFKVALPAAASQILTAASLPVQGYLSRLAGRSAMSHSVVCGRFSNEIGTVAGFRAALALYDQPQTPFGSITPSVFNGEIRGLVSSTNSPNQVSLSVLGYIPVGTRVQISVEGLGSDTQAVMRGGDVNYSCLFNIDGAFERLVQLGTTCRVDLRVV